MDWDQIPHDLISAIPPTVAVVLAWWSARRQVNGVHVIVNSQRTEMMKEIDALKGEIRDSKDELRSLRRATEDPPISGV